MSRRPLRIATTKQLELPVRQAGFDVYLLPETVSTDFNRPLSQRLKDGAVYRSFLEEHDIELVLDYNTAAMTFVESPERPGTVSLTTAALGIPYVACYVDAVTATMGEVGWADRWQILESPEWIKGFPDRDMAEELIRLGIGNLLRVPLGISGDFDTRPPPAPRSGPVVAFMGHPATSWFRTNELVPSGKLFTGLLAAAVRADMPDLLFHKIFFDLYQLGEPPKATDDLPARARKAADYFEQKFVYNVYLAVKQRDRFARFLKLKLGDVFELIGDHWDTHYGLQHTPRIWDMKVLHERMRTVPICLNMIKGCGETGLNFRHFEITAHGGFMLTYPTAELPDYFEVGVECDVFHDEHELLEKISYYLANPAKRREIAAAGQRRTLSEHQHHMRIAQLVQDLRANGVLPATGVAS